MKAIEKAKDFLLNLKHIELDDSYPLEEFYDFSKPHLPYYVYMDANAYGCYSYDARFMSKKDVNKLIAEQCCEENNWDTIVILDVKQNKTVVPHI